MRKPTTKAGPRDEPWDDPLVIEIRPVVREAIEDVLEEELNRALGARWYGREGSRAGHRNGSIVRAIGTPLGPTEVEVPRARLFGPDGGRRNGAARSCRATPAG